MPTPRPQNVKTLHSAKTSISIYTGSSEGMTNMQWAIHVWVWKSNHNLMSFQVRISLENVRSIPFGLPFLLDLLGLAHETC
jgi:hypothetical protein